MTNETETVEVQAIDRTKLMRVGPEAQIERMKGWIPMAGKWILENENLNLTPTLRAEIEQAVYSAGSIDHHRRAKATANLGILIALVALGFDEEPNDDILAR